ncbi:Ribosomal protein S12 methylthiotransferase RimO [Enhygromyxa salina]|uniref:Ribosomal protein S12 methylthiotransferase RimO n=1 Tax=Enhygromyxa salina TaxID=215803 RepID=A0A2S9XWZ1_9BACT|nr:PhpK family radical SAM P-methyltransferase [Enhygromyxa salina]PRP97398.1 Ribosomal protein S12 methylthiotransferase RimO [Enhygromyxa salina]
MTARLDCLLVGMNSQRFVDYLDLVKSHGQSSGAYRDIRLSYVDYEGAPHQALDLLTKLYVRDGGTREVPFHNADFIWPTITYLGGYLTRRGLSFDFINAFTHEREALREKLRTREVLAVAISTTLYVVPWPITEIIEFVRSCDPNVAIVVGGPYIANVTKSDDRLGVERQLQALGADYYVISSEGEATLARLLHALRSGAAVGEIDNLAIRDGERMVFTPSVVERNPIEDNPVDYTLFSPEQIGQFVSTRTAKSCPFACAFCNFPEQAGKYTYTSVADVERELDNIRAIGTVTTLTFIDDTFNVPKKRFREILRMMIRNEYWRDFRWNCTLRSDHTDDEIIALMAKAGCEGVFLGVESGSPKMLAAMNKTAKREDYLRAIPRLADEGILAHANVFIGFPGETRETVEETLDLIRTTRPVTFSAQPWYANPLTPVWKKKELYQIQGSSFRWSHSTMDAATACDLVDHVFQTVDESIFLPQYGFFQWSLFYLQRQGMALERIKGYLRAFNAVVREKISGVVDERVHAGLIANLEAAAAFEDRPEPAPEVRASFSAEARLAAESYCREAFVPTLGGGQALARSLEGDGDGDGDCTVELPPALTELRDPLALSTRTLAAIAVLAWRLDELRAIGLVIAGAPVAPASDAAFPIALEPRPTLTFAAWEAEVGEQLVRAHAHRVHSLDVLTSGSRVLPFHDQSPKFSIGLWIDGAGDLPPPWRDVPAYASIGLELRLTTTPGAAALRLGGTCPASTRAELRAQLATLLGRSAATPEAPLASATVGPPTPATAVSSLTREGFSF